jgi:hypothetical protein
MDNNIICDKCDKYEVSLCGTHETCHALFEMQTIFINGITKEYIEQRMIGEKNHCKEYKPIRK